MTYLASKLTAAQAVTSVEMELPAEVPEGHVRLKLATASLCGTDLHYFKHFANAGFQLQNALTLGHEACATVVDANGADLAPGQLVALNPIIFCGECKNCGKGLVNLCTAKKFPGSGTTVPHLDGFFREYFDFPAFCCHAVPDDTDPDHLTFAEPLSCSMHAVNKGDVGAGTTVCVTGCGPMGLLAVVAAASKGAQVAVTDVRAEVVALACEIGASKGYVAGTDDIGALAATFDVVIEASGNPHAFNQALDLVKRQGKVVILSNIQPSQTPIHLHKIMLKEIQVVGSFQFNKEFAEAVELVTSKQADFDKLIAARFALSQTAEALQYMADGKAFGKILLKPDA
ncbi:alcohol dehydrogenase catalytic domain-containing protein [Fluviibacterium sp. DFM31]|uniref:Alcohol dehydrogenase catalytic domain-containing protein n=1 Tax=Meridianimarinicoccus marinus TaxID=3231483 RepID=A0ABV3L7Q8_9RHOB